MPSVHFVESVPRLLTKELESGIIVFTNTKEVKILNYSVNKFWEVWGYSDSLYEKWAEERGENRVRLFVLYALDRQYSVTQKDIAEYTGLSKQTVHTVIRALKAEGYVTLESGNSSDKREKNVVMTESGHAYCKELLTPLYEVEKNVFDIMGADKIKQMIDSITLFNTLFEKETKRKC